MFLTKERSDLTADRERVAALLAKMTLSEKVGQLLMVGFKGETPPEKLRDFLCSGLAGGVILFADNVAEPDQVLKLTGALREAACQSPQSVPLFIAVDQEGGPVIRLNRGVAVFPGNMAIGATGREEYAYQSGKAMAEELTALGINMNLAPVLDVNSNPDNPIIGIRSFGADPEAVARLGTAAVKGLQDGGVLAVGKHFPGHGDTTVDSHLNLPVIAHPLSRLDTVELTPFRAAICNGVDGIMTAHIVFPALEPTTGRPATLSAAILTDLLRRKMGFQGLIMTDCLEMEAIAANYEIGDAVVLAVLAGADQLLISHTCAKQQAAHQAILARVTDGTIPVALLDAAVGRILTAKLALGTKATKKTAQSSPQAGEWREHWDLAREIAAASLTLLRNRQRLLPLQLQPEEELLVISFPQKITVVEANNGFDAGLAGAIAGRHPRVSQVVLADEHTAAMREQLQATLDLKRPALIMIVTRNARRHSGQAEVVKWLAANGYRLVVIALRTPYDLLAFPEVDTYVAAYGFRSVTLEALVKLLWGEILPQGKLPVSLPGLYPLGSGMETFEA
jgi:beta-N-acetylhexosaminidase